MIRLCLWCRSVYAVAAGDITQRGDLRRECGFAGRGAESCAADAHIGREEEREGEWDSSPQEEPISQRGQSELQRPLRQWHSRNPGCHSRLPYPCWWNSVRHSSWYPVVRSWNVSFLIIFYATYCFSLAFVGLL